MSEHITLEMFSYKEEKFCSSSTADATLDTGIDSFKLASFSLSSKHSSGKRQTAFMEQEGLR